MAFFDKINSLAKNVGEKTNDALEINRMNSKINSEKSAIVVEQKKIGEYYYNKRSEGAQLDEGVAEFCTAIDESNRIIKENEEAIQKLKDEREVQKQVAAEEAAAAKEAKQVTTQVVQTQMGTQPQGITCPSCRVVNTQGMKFCKECGTKLEVEVQQPIEVVEQQVEIEVVSTVQEEPTKRSCPSCNMELGSDVAFCSQCGEKVE